MDKLPPLPQEYYDENRTLFDGQTTISENTVSKCVHSLEKKGDDLICKACGAGWIGLARYVHLQTQKNVVENTV